MNRNKFELAAAEIQNEINKGNIAGASLCLLKNGEEIYRNEFGYADKEAKLPMKQDTIFRMFSMSKPVTAVAVMILFERGKIDLFEPVSKYLQGFKNQKVATAEGLVDTKKEVTIKDLLNMTSGIAYPDESFEAGILMDKLYKDIKEKLESGCPTSTIDYCNEIGKIPLAFQPGDAWLYGASADILGAVVEIVSGKKFSEFLKEEIFIPLGMVDTDFYVPAEKQYRFAQIYDYNAEQGSLKPFLDNHLGLNNYLTPPAFESAGAGLVSIIDDYSKFASMLLSGGQYKGARILGRKTVAFLSQSQLDEKQQESFQWDSLKGYGYGNLMRVLKSKSEAATNGSLGEFGWDGWTGNYFFIDPEEQLIMLYMIQKTNTGTTNFTRKLRALVYSALD
jgi:CubicO group peptidase (beta-lactamase class C family)